MNRPSMPSTLPEETLAVLDRVASKGKRLRPGYRAHAEDSLGIAEEWFRNPPGSHPHDRPPTIDPALRCIGCSIDAQGGSGAQDQRRLGGIAGRYIARGGD